jgi:hypothetical protein
MRLLLRIVKYLLILVLLILVLLAAVVAFAPWERWLEERLIAEAQARGVSPVALKVDAVGVYGVVLSDVAVGEPPYRLAKATLGISPLALLRRAPDAQVTLRSEQLAFKAGETPVTLGAVEVLLRPNPEFTQWQGTWKITALEATSERLPLPPLDGAGTLQFAPQALQIEGTLKNDSNSHGADFAYMQALDTPDAPPQLTIRQARMPWGGGSVGVKEAQLLLGEKKAIPLTLQVTAVELQTLLQLLSSSGTTATGVVSGSLPVVVQPDGSFTIGKGAMQAEAPGIITLAPDMIPGDSPQLSLVRDVLKNLHYQTLTLEFDGDTNRVLKVNLRVEGKNPTMDLGRPIKLNVQLSGDLLNLLTQNMQLMTDPQTFIEQNAHAPAP